MTQMTHTSRGVRHLRHADGAAIGEHSAKPDGAAAHPLKHAPGAEFEYTSANTIIVDRLIGQFVGGGPMGLRAFAEREIFAPLHMPNVTMEFDGAGVFVGSTWVYAPARAFARFRQLYLMDGIAPDGRRVLPEGWVAWSRRSTLGALYGAGSWTNDGPSRSAANRVAGGFSTRLRHRRRYRAHKGGDPTDEHGG